MTKMTADLHEAVIVIAREAGQAIMAVYEGAFDVQRKNDDSPLTAAATQGRHEALHAVRKRGAH